MGYTGYNKPSNKIVVGGKPPLVQELKIETVANMYAGRLVQKGTNQDDMKVGGIGAAYGWLGYEQSNPGFRPADVDTIYTVDDMAAVLKGGGFAILASLAASFSVKKNDKVANWANGQVMGPVEPMLGGLALKIPFIQKTTEFDTGIDIPANMIVLDAAVEVTTNVAASWIDVGILSSEPGGDADGFLIHPSCAAAGMVSPILSHATEASLTLGALLGTHQKSADITALYEAVRKAFVADGTAKSLTYTTSAHAITGNIWLALAYPGFRIVGEAGETVDASAAAADLIVESVI